MTETEKNIEPIVKRLDYVDVAKLLGMFLVVFCHAIGRDDRLTSTIYAFHLPLFFLLNGITLKVAENQTFGAFLEKKIKSYVVPVLCLGFIEILLDIYTRNRFGFPVDPTFKGNMIINLIGQTRVYTIWFMGALFFADVFFYFVIKLGRNNIFFMAVWVALILHLAIYFNKYYQYRTITWNIDVSLFGVLFVYVGYIFSHKTFARINKFLLKNRLIALLFGVLIFLIGWWFGNKNYLETHYHLEMWARYYNKYYYVLPSGCFCSLGFTLVCYAISNKVFAFLGRSTLTVFAFHQMFALPIFFNVFAKNWQHMVMTIPTWANWDVLWFATCATLFCFAILMPWYFAIRYSPFSFIVGQRMPRFYLTLWQKIKDKALHLKEKVVK